MPGLGGLTQRLLWVAESKTKRAGAEQSGAAAEIGGVTPEVSCPGTGQPPPHTQAGFGCSRKRVYHQMRVAGIVSTRRRPYKAITNSRYSHPPAPNLLQQKFYFEHPNQA